MLILLVVAIKASALDIRYQGKLIDILVHKSRMLARIVVAVSQRSYM